MWLTWSRYVRTYICSIADTYEWIWMWTIQFVRDFAGEREKTGGRDGGKIEQEYYILYRIPDSILQLGSVWSLLRFKEPEVTGNLRWGVDVQLISF